jgi:hypothetical protein
MIERLVTLIPRPPLHTLLWSGHLLPLKRMTNSFYREKGISQINPKWVYWRKRSIFTFTNTGVQATPAVGFSAKKSSLHHKASHLLFIKNKQK